MKVMKAILVGLMVVVLAVAVPVAAIAVDYQAAQGDGHANSTAAAGAAAPATKDVAVVIRHQTRHCHAWSVNGNAYAADQSAQLAVGDSITVTNKDVMSHKLVEMAGPAATITTPAMDKPSATSTITFAEPGTYLLGTQPGEDYTKGVVTTGADNVLRMTVVVTAPGTSAPQPAALVIRHQTRHCHAWSYNGSPYASDQTAQLAVGDSIKVTNNDVMGHRFVQLTGPATAITTPAMDKPGATSTITFVKPGTYVLGTVAGEDYSQGVVTTGADNVLRMKVVVS